MAGSVLLDRHILAKAFYEIETIRQTLPQTALTALAQEVVQRVAVSLHVLPMDFLPTSEEIDGLCQALLSTDPHAAIALIEQAQKNGASYEALCLSNLAVAARRLGEWWDEDRVSFYEVTLAAGRIYAILRTLRLDRLLPTPDMRRSAIFASVPDDLHTLGITIAADLARDKGWDIELFTGLPHAELVHTFEARETALIGLSASGKRSLPALIKLIVALRISNPRARILVCGQIAASSFNLVGITGADAAATDFEGAIEHLERWVTMGAARVM